MPTEQQPSGPDSCYHSPRESDFPLVGKPNGSLARQKRHTIPVDVDSETMKLAQQGKRRYEAPIVARLGIICRYSD